MTTRRDRRNKLRLIFALVYSRGVFVLLDRLHWDSWDPTHICEGIFAVANVLSFSRLFYLLAANEQLGPLQISLRRMISVSSPNDRE